MKISKKLRAIGLGALFCLSSQILNPTQIQAQEDPKKYAILFSAGSDEDKKIDLNSFDEGVKNRYLITISSIYDSLRKIGFDKKNIKVFYDNGTLDLNEEKNKKEILKLNSEQFNRNYNNRGSKINLEETLKDLEDRIKENDQLIVYITNHGYRKWTTLPFKDYFDFNENNQIMDNEEFKELTKNIKAKEQVYIFDFCWDNEFGKVMPKKAIALTSTSQPSTSVSSRTDQFGRFVGEAMSNPKADLNKDGLIKISEAFQYAEERRKPFVDAHCQIGDCGAQPKENFYGQIHNLENNDFTVFNLNKVEEDYLILKERIEEKRKIFQEKFKSAKTNEKKNKILLESKEYILNTIKDGILPFWYDTPWEYEGITKVPKKGSISCGHFLTRVLNAAGFNIVNDMGIQPAGNIIKNLTSENYIKEYENKGIEEIIKDLREAEENLYIIGLDNHTGLIINKTIPQFYNSSPLSSSVVEEDVKNAPLIENSKYKMMGSILHEKLLKKWLNKEFIPAKYDYFKSKKPISLVEQQ